jgi:hypothetical protein
VRFFLKSRERFFAPMRQTPESPSVIQSRQHDLQNCVAGALPTRRYPRAGTANDRAAERPGVCDLDEPVDGHTMNFQVGRQLSCVHDFAGASGYSISTPSHFAPIRRASGSITVRIQALSPSAASPAASRRIRFSSGMPRT